MFRCVADFLAFQYSQGSVAMHLRYGGIFNYQFSQAKSGGKKC